MQFLEPELQVERFGDRFFVNNHWGLAVYRQRLLCNYNGISNKAIQVKILKRRAKHRG